MKDSRNSFFQFISTYVLFFLCILAVLIPTYLYIFNQFSRQCLRENYQHLERRLDMVTNGLESLTAYSQRLSGKEALARAAALDLPLTNQGQYYVEKARQEMVQSFAPYSELYEMVVEYGVCLPNGVVLTSRRVFASLEDCYGGFLRCEGMEADEWVHFLSERAVRSGLCPEMTYYTPEQGEFAGITFARGSKMEYSKANYISFYIFKADRLLSELSVSPDTVISLYNYDNSALAVLGSRREGENYRPVQYRSPTMGFYAMVDIPDSGVRAQVRPVFLLTMLSIGLFLVLGIALSIYFSYRNAQPIRALVQLFPGGGKGEKPKNEYAYVLQSIKKMGMNLEQAQQALQAQEGLVRAGMMERLLHGLLYTQAEWAQARSLFGNLPQTYCLCQLCAEPAREDDNLSGGSVLLFAVRAFTRMFETPPLFHLIDDGRMVVVLPVDESHPDPEDYQPMLEQVAADLRRECRTRVVIAVSDIFSEVEGLSDAFRQTRQIRRLEGWEGTRSVIFKRDLPVGAAWSPVDFADSQRFYELIMAADRVHAVAMIAHAFRTVRKAGYVTDAYIHRSFLAFQQVFERIKSEDLVEQDAFQIPAYSATANIDELAQQLTETAERLCGAIEQGNRRQETARAAALLAYLDAHLSDPALSLSAVSEEFNLTDRAVQGILREVSGKSFFEYVDAKRMALAHQLLTESDRSIGEIAQCCGFQLANSFYKAFRRCYGVSPSSLRSQAAGGKTGVETGVETGIETDETVEKKAVSEKKDVEQKAVSEKKTVSEQKAVEERKVAEKKAAGKKAAAEKKTAGKKGRPAAGKKNRPAQEDPAPFRSRDEDPFPMRSA